MKSNRYLSTATLTLAVAGGLLAWTACSDDSSAIKEPSPDAAIRPDGSGGTSGTGIPDAGTLPDGAPKDCFDNPTNHFEIINACTGATKIQKTPNLPRVDPDGRLPPPG